MQKKEFYRNRLPHFQEPGQAYFITWNIKDAVPPKALIRYTTKLKEIKTQIEFQKRNKTIKTDIDKLVHEYNKFRSKYLKAYDDQLHASGKPFIDLSKTTNVNILKEALHFWEGRKLTNYAYAIMPNHVHWVLNLKKYDEKGNLVFLQDIMQSVKRYTAVNINIIENRNNTLWQKESFDTTIRNDLHLYNAIEYTLLNPVKAGFVKDWEDWEGCWYGF